MPRSTMLILIVLGFFTVFLVGWVMLYPSQDDPKNIQYVLWKTGLPTMDADRAAGTMIGDVDREKMILGKTREQLRSRFGYLTPLAQASPYLQNCYLSSGRTGQDVLFVRRGPWMVVFHGDRASELVLIKGC